MNLVETLGEWRSSGGVSLETGLKESLALDDYVYQKYVKGDHVVALYVGYYWSTVKVGAAHDPLVCFPGQGWNLSDRQTGILELDVQGERKVISHASMIAARGQEKELIFYWFQANEQTASNTFVQKTMSFWERLRRGREDNAFVRISMPIAGMSRSTADKTVVDFVMSFYPAFLNYIRGEDLRDLQPAGAMTFADH